MSNWSANILKGVQDTQKSHQKLIKSFNRSFSTFKNKVNDAIDELAINVLTKRINCQLCATFLVMTARNSCCSICFVEWMNEDDDDDNHDDNIVCRKCARPIKTVMNTGQLYGFCELVELDEKKKPGGHFGYPVLGTAAMDLLFEGLENDSETLDNDSETSENDPETLENDSETLENDSEALDNDSETNITD